MNILFALHNPINSNSGFHVVSLAHELTQLGHDCVIAVPTKDSSEENNADSEISILDFTETLEACQQETLFRNRKPIDIFHAWTPREVICKFHEAICPAFAKVTLVHLEDNEEELARAFLGSYRYEQAQAGKADDFPPNLTHPIKGKLFLAKAQGVTVIIDALKAAVPEGIPTEVIWPAADDRLFYPRERQIALYDRYAIQKDAITLVYTGNGHAANRQEVRSLYLAVHLLNRRGVKAQLIRTGKDYFVQDEQYKQWASQYAINLGYLQNRENFGDLLSLADVLVQPGKPGLFNDMRFPSKLPEFFACGRPVVLPRTNIGLVTRHLQDAFVLDNANGPAIADAVETIIGNPELSNTLSKGGRAFYEANLSWRRSAETLANFYQTCRC